MLSRHRRRRRDPIINGITHDAEEASNDSRRQNGASATPTSGRAEAGKMTATSKYTKVNVSRETLQRRGGMGPGSGGGTTDILGLALIGSGLTLVTPQVMCGMNTIPPAISESVKGVRTISAPESKPSRYPLEGSRGKNADNVKGVGRHRKYIKNNAGTLDQKQSVGGPRIVDTDEIGGALSSISQGDRPSEDYGHPRGRSTGIIRGKRTSIRRDRISLAERGALMVSSLRLPLSDK